MMPASTPSLSTPSLAGARVLVIGASGFIGARLVERLVLEHGASVRALIRSVAGATRIARFPIDVTVGDVLDPAAVAAAAAGCTVIFNCAKGTGRDAARRRATDVDGARHVADAAARAGARVVHVSTMVVYDLPYDGHLDERAPDAPLGDAYADAKREGERVALGMGAERNVPTVVVQPAVVYGPYSTVHASEILDELRHGRMLMVDGGNGICNAVYVDDVVTALLLAATADGVAGERFLVSGPEHPTWRDFYGGFERMLGVQRTLSISEDDALALWRRSRRRRWLLGEAARIVRTDRALRKRLLATREGAAARWVAERLTPRALSRAEAWAATPVEAVTRGHAAEAQLPVSPLRPWLVAYLAKRARVRIDKAERLLGYRPRFGLAEGLRLTEAWARWAGLVDLP